MGTVGWLKRACEYAGGAADDPPPGLPVAPGSPLWGVWWGALGAAIVLFCGQSSKFIYIDF